MIWISDTGPIIALAKVRKLSVLRDLADDVWIPPIVHRELYGRLDADARAIERALSGFISVHEPKPPADVDDLILTGLDAGERQVIELALAGEDGTVVLMDDYAGREVTKSLGLRLTGTVGLLCMAKENGLISGVVALLQRMRRNGYWLSDKTIEIARELAGE